LSRTIIYLSRWLPIGLNLPTLYLERAVLKRYYMWHFSMQGLPANNVAIKSCELLPHIFTFTSPGRGSYFLWHYLFPPCGETRLLTGALLCAVRTFLPNVYSWSDSLACSRTKILLCLRFDINVIECLLNKLHAYPSIAYFRLLMNQLKNTCCIFNICLICN
jgi:hypothetical protein